MSYGSSEFHRTSHVVISVLGEAASPWLVVDRLVVVDIDGKLPSHVRKGASQKWKIAPGRRTIRVSTQYPVPPLTTLVDLAPGKTHKFVIEVNDRWPRATFARAFEIAAFLSGLSLVYVVWLSDLTKYCAIGCLWVWAEIVYWLDPPVAVLAVASMIWSSRTIPIYIGVLSLFAYAQVRNIILRTLFDSLVIRYGFPLAINER